MEVTLLQHAKDSSPGRIGIDELAALIRGENRPEAYQPLIVVASVLEGGRQKQHVRWLTGLAVAHITPVARDRLEEARQMAGDDLHTMLCFADTAGDGLYIVYPFELSDGFGLSRQFQYYPRVFARGSEYYARLLGAHAERTCGGVTRAVPVPLDREAVYNPSALWFTSDEIHTKPPDGRQEDRGSKEYARPKDIRAFLDGRIFLRRNLVKGRPEYRNPDDPPDGWRLLDNTKLNTLFADMLDERNVQKDVMLSTINSEYYPAFHPFREYLDSLPPWDGGNNILQLSLMVTVKGSVEKQMLFAEYLRKWLVGMVAGWIDDSEVNSAMLILIGRQGIRKTTWFNHLLPPVLRQYYCLKTDSGRMEKDDRLKLSQYGLICCEELDAMSNYEMNKLKSVMTMVYIDERAPFDRYPEQRKHIASYCGTGNNVIFLKDETGTRRFLPFEVERIDDPRTTPIDYEAVFAEAYALYRQGFRYYFSGEEEDLLRQHNQRFETPRPEEDLIDYYFRKPSDTELGEVVSPTVAAQIVSTSAVRVSGDALARAFERMGFESVLNGYRVVRRSDEERRQRGSSLAYEARYGIKPKKE